LDESDPNRWELSPIDIEDETIAQPTNRSHISGHVPGGSGLLRGTYWFIREMYKAEIEAAIAKDKRETRPHEESALAPAMPRPVPTGMRRVKTVPMVAHSQQTSEQAVLPTDLPTLLGPPNHSRFPRFHYPQPGRIPSPDRPDKIH